MFTLDRENNALHIHCPSGNTYHVYIGGPIFALDLASGLVLGIGDLVLGEKNIPGIITAFSVAQKDSPEIQRCMLSLRQEPPMGVSVAHWQDKHLHVRTIASAACVGVHFVYHPSIIWRHPDELRIPELGSSVTFLVGSSAA